MLLVGVLTRIAMPQMQDVLTRARATEIRATFAVIEEAATRLTVENQPWPQDADAGVVPAALSRNLPQGFSFTIDPKVHRITSYQLRSVYLIENIQLKLWINIPKK